MNVLLVDDSETMRIIQKRCLNKIGVEQISEASDGVIGLEIFHQKTFDIILTDWNMPNMDGLQFLIEIRKVNQSIPVVMVTTEAERERIVSAMEAGVTDYLIKPFSPDMLREKMEQWMSIPT